MGSLAPYFFVAAAMIISMAAAQQCRTALQINGASKQYNQCVNVGSQNAAIAWTYYPGNRTLDMAFFGEATSTSGWVAWGYNPQAPQMPGSTALLAFQNATGSFLLQYSLLANSKSIGAGNPTNSSTDLTVITKSDPVFSGTSVSFTALIQLTNDNGGNINHIWNRGPGMSNGDVPQGHGPSNSNSNGGSLNLLRGTSTTASVPNLHLKNAHGILNAISWGFLLPIGAMSARYLRPFKWADPAWFYIHASCQTLGYILGVVGWAFGLQLGNYSEGIVHDNHRNIGIAIFVFGTLQVLALFLRPNKSHDLRIYWNVYHHTIGYTTIVLAIVNIFKGFDILAPAKGWKRAYIGLIIALAVMSLVYEVITWIAFFARKRASKQEKTRQPRWEDSNPYGAQPAV